MKTCLFLFKDGNKIFSKSTEGSIMKSFLYCFVCLLLASMVACGITPDDPSHQPASYEEIAGLIETKIESCAGNEIGQYQVAEESMYGSTFNIDYLGMALCSPNPITTPPASNPVPPLNIYGTANDVPVSLVSSEADRVTYEIECPDLFVDFNLDSEGMISIHGGIHCKESVTVTLVIQLAEHDSGCSIPVAIMIHETTVTINETKISIDGAGLVGAIANSVIGLFQNEFSMENTIKEFVILILEDFISDLPCVPAS